MQVEGVVTEPALQQLAQGVDLSDFVTAPATVMAIPEPAELWPRSPPIRVRMAIPTAWLAITISEGKNRQVRRMTAKVVPTLRLIRYQIGDWMLEDLAPGEWTSVLKTA